MTSVPGQSRPIEPVKQVQLLLSHVDEHPWATRSTWKVVLWHLEHALGVRQQKSTARRWWQYGASQAWIAHQLGVTPRTVYSAHRDETFRTFVAQLNRWPCPLHSPYQYKVILGHETRCDFISGSTEDLLLIGNEVTRLPLPIGNEVTRQVPVLWNEGHGVFANRGGLSPVDGLLLSEITTAGETDLARLTKAASAYGVVRETVSRRLSRLVANGLVTKGSDRLQVPYPGDLDLWAMLLEIDKDPSRGDGEEAWGHPKPEAEEECRCPDPPTAKVA